MTHPPAAELVGRSAEIIRLTALLDQAASRLSRWSAGRPEWARAA